MFSNVFQKISETVRQWFVFARFPDELILIPIKARQNEPWRYPPSKRVLIS